MEGFGDILFEAGDKHFYGAVVLSWDFHKSKESVE
jgi:hypothetical protein